MEEFDFAVSKIGLSSSHIRAQTFRHDEVGLGVPVFRASHYEASERRIRDLLLSVGAKFKRSKLSLDSNTDVDLTNASFGINALHLNGADRFFLWNIHNAWANTGKKIDSESASYGGFGLFGWNVQPNWQVQIGAFRSGGFVDTRFLPLLGSSIILNKKLTLRMLLPLKMTLDYASNVDLMAQTGMRIGGGNWRDEETGGDRLQYYHLEVFAGVTHKFWQRFEAGLELGRITARKIRWFDGNDEQSSKELSPESYLKVNFALSTSKHAASSLDMKQPRQEKTPPPDVRQHEIKHQDYYRTYYVIEPATAKTKPAAVIFLHGGGGAAREAITSTGLSEAANKHGFVAVFPQGFGIVAGSGGQAVGTWNAGWCCPPATEEKIDDVGFISKVIDALVKDYDVDPKRVYVSGLSNGAMMTYVLACELPHKIAAVAAVGSQPSSNVREVCKNPSPVPILYVHSRMDKCSPLQGGTCGDCMNEFVSNCFHIPSGPSYPRLCPSVEASMDFWQERNHCSGTRKIVSQNADYTCYSYDKCQAAVQYCEIVEGGHHWPKGKLPRFCYDSSGGPKNSPLCSCWQGNVHGEDQGVFDANEIAWRFFTSHGR